MPSSRFRASALHAAIVMVAAGSILSCSESSGVPSIAAPEPRFAAHGGSGGPVVSSTVPFAAARGTTLDVQINGSGFDATSRASFERQGVIDPKVHVNTTRYVKSTQLVASVTIDSDATTALYDVGVALASGKKGIGTERFEVELNAEVLPGSTSAKDVNASGDAIANYPTGGSCPAAVTPGVIALYHMDGTKVLLPLPASGLYCSANGQAINESGMVLGRLIGAGTVPSTLAIWTPFGGSYTIRELGPAPDGARPNTNAGLNNPGEVIGWTNVFANVAKVYWWSDGTGWLSMPVPSGATMCNVYNGINDRGEIVGKCTVSGVTNPYYWQNHSAAPVMMPTPTGVTGATPQDINNSGVVVGYSPALRWTPNGSGGWTAEKLPDAGNGASAYRIFDDGSIAGSVSRSISGSIGPLPAVWPQGGAYRLLAVTSGSWGEALSVAMTPMGLVVVGGDRGEGKGYRWRAAPLP